MNKLILSGAMLLALGLNTANADDFKLVATNDYEPVKAKIIDSTPENFTINVKNLSNLGVDQDAPVFAVYTSGSKPSECADFTTVKITYKKPEKYLRLFDLSDKPEIVSAIEKQQCVAIKNIPAT